MLCGDENSVWGGIIGVGEGGTRLHGCGECDCRGFPWSRGSEKGSRQGRIGEA
jgi:hypothetical protein